MSELPHIIGERIYCRLAQVEDISQIIAFHRQNDPTHFAPWNPELPNNYYEPEFWQKKIEQSHEEFQSQQSLRLLIFLKADDQLIGTANYTSFERGPFQNCRLGYKIGASHEGKGLMREALQTSLDYIFQELKLHRVEANYIPANNRSGNLLKRLGFQEHGLAPNYLKIAGEWQDHLLTSLINPYWQD